MPATSFRISLPEAATVAHSACLHADVNEALTSGQSIVFDADQTETIDAAVLQLLPATRTAASSRQLDFALLNVPEQLARTLDAAGAVSLLAHCNDDPDEGKAVVEGHSQEGEQQ